MAYLTTTKTTVAARCAATPRPHVRRVIGAWRASQKYAGVKMPHEYQSANRSASSIPHENDTPTRIRAAAASSAESSAKSDHSAVKNPTRARRDGGGETIGSAAAVTRSR